jgi:hypothetical protein
MILVVSDLATLFYHILESPGHGLRQVLEVGGVLHPDDPQLEDLLVQLLQVGGGGALQPSTA